MHELYALALALVPDPDVAGDLFMAARDEADLRKRADRWRQRHGLSPAANAPVLSALSPAQHEHARHLLGRGRRRRRLVRVLAASAVGATLMLFGTWVWRPPTPTGLAADPVFAGRFLSATDPQAGLGRRPGEGRLESVTASLQVGAGRSNDYSQPVHAEP